MKTIQIAPGDSAGGSLQQAMLQAGRDDEVLRFLDDLSCGPIASDDHQARVDWWRQFFEADEREDKLKAFWKRVTTTEDRLVVWYGRHSAQELAFFLAFSDRLGERPYEFIDVAGHQWYSTRRDGSTALGVPATAAGTIPPEQLRSFLGTERRPTAEEREAAGSRWRRLKAENAPFRIVTDEGLASAPIDHFDHLIMGQVTTEWQRINRVIGYTLGETMEPYLQVGDVMLHERLIALVEGGQLEADGDPGDMFDCRVRLPDVTVAQPT